MSLALLTKFSLDKPPLRERISGAKSEIAYKLVFEIRNEGIFVV